MRDFVSFFLNGQPVQVRGRAAFGLLAPYLRGERGLTGTKIACGHGACGSCSVLIGRPNNDGETDYQPINACLFPVFAADGAHVVTVEGVNGAAHVGGGDDGVLSPVQSAMVECHGAQCGFCTPGMVVTLTARCQNGGFASRGEAQAVLEGNLCRCTGYAPILDAALAIDAAQMTPLNRLYPIYADVPDGSVQITVAADDLEGEQTVFVPTTLAQAAQWKAAHPAAIVVAGATEIGLAMSVKGVAPREILSVANVAELDEIRVENGELMLGARANWTQVEAATRDVVPAFAQLLQRWGSPQLRNMGTVAGNVMRAASNSDSLPFYLVCEAELELVGATGTRRLKVGDYVADKTSVRTDELLARVVVPLPDEAQVLRIYKVTERRAFARSVVSAALLLTAQNGTIDAIKIAVGGAAPDAIRLPQTEAWLRGQPLESATWRGAAEIAQAEVAPISDAAARREYRLQLVGNLLKKFGREI